MENYICTKCKYRFKSSKTPETCPYCGKSGIEREESAENIVEEIKTIIE